jgi:hypothetical protein
MSFILSPTKRCSKCREEKSEDLFYRRKKTGKVGSWCRKCIILSNRQYKDAIAATAKRRRRDNPELVRKMDRLYTLKRRYGLTRENYNDILISQDYSCALCKASEAGGRGEWHVDHDHNSGVIRGLLCASCNIRLGVYESIKDLIGIANIEEYITRSNVTLPLVRKRAA